MSTEPEERERAPLLDVRLIPYDKLFSHDESSALANAVRRLAGKVALPQDALAAFTSYVE